MLRVSLRLIAGAWCVLPGALVAQAVAAQAPPAAPVDAAAQVPAGPSSQVPARPPAQAAGQVPAAAVADARASAPVASPTHAPAQSSTVARASALLQAPAASPADGPEGHLEAIEVVSRRLNEARTGIETQVGASVYTIDAAAIAAMPGGDNGLLNQAIMQAPEVAQDSFGQFHVRGEHNGLQYRLNGIILPEGISGFGQSLDPRLISSMQLITGALPAEYGLRTAGIIDLSTKSGALDPGGTVSLYGGSHGTMAPSINYGGTSGSIQYFVSGDAMVNDLGIESPDGRSTPLHDRTKQYHGFGYLEKVIDADNRLSLIMATSNGQFQIPNRAGEQPQEGYTVAGQTSFDSAALNETQREQTSFAIVGWQHSRGPLDLQASFTARNSTLQFTPDPIGDLLFEGIAQSARKNNLAFDAQLDVAWQINESHTLRTGGFAQSDRSTSDTRSLVVPLKPSPATPLNREVQAGPPITIAASGAHSERIASLYVQDEWKWTAALTLNYGLRLDDYVAYSSGNQLSPRVNLVWKPLPRTTVHAGYARYFSPPPFELVGTANVTPFNNTSAAFDQTLASTPQAERANYTDIGVLQKVSQQFTLGFDSYFKRSAQLIDEGQFGAPIILTPFNYGTGRQYGAELTANYSTAALAAYLNLGWQSAQGSDITSSQFNFAIPDLAYIANHYISLDHEQKVTASGGLSYGWGDTRVSADFLLGSGLRADLQLADGSNIPNGRRLPYYAQTNAGISHVFHLGGWAPVTGRFDVVNLFDRVYEIRNGTGIGVGAPQYGPRRGFFVGFSRPL
jgi:outer membrane receptor protein involved in Fe transport